MRRVLTGALTLVLCGSTWLAAANTEKKEPARKQATASSAQTMQQMQTQVKKQQEQIHKLQMQLQQSYQALQQAQQKLQVETQQTGQQAATAQQKANSLNEQVTGVQTPPGNVDQKPQAK
jgi:Skp family chaperone for outer membrane proteins